MKPQFQENKKLNFCGLDGAKVGIRNTNKPGKTPPKIPSRKKRRSAAKVGNATRKRENLPERNRKPGHKDAAEQVAASAPHYEAAPRKNWEIMESGNKVGAAFKMFRYIFEK